jgi:cellulose synthase/poly-beta-1,6-N-acetylglucosamine synthase-like glycosyltransferase
LPRQGEVLTKPNGGKAAALNYAVDRLTEEFYVGIDADTVIAQDAIAKLMPHFEDPRSRRRGRATPRWAIA